MKKIVMIFLACMLCVSFTSVSFAQQKGASEQAREHASDNAIFNRVGDWFATVGKKGAEKEAVLAERKAKRQAKKAEKMGLEGRRLIQANFVNHKMVNQYHHLYLKLAGKDHR